ncbi:WhiB family transcriptional regulator [Georgenia thermotolerans]|uniref:Transcriptional regulator WhiB n=1 Tax=Georgenia thermotolerans TaxID=527326 RepID=A0A7J5UPJ6_9MICO|nr:WhiB family transcriptional regulator [Georgenia thermotolerans]KAE8764140.1 WhiB family transcriptional regulator [Georgenia thermotolerans]
MRDQSWAARAACAQGEPDTLFVRGAAQRSAREVCFSCPVRRECLADALDSQTEFGVWGGMTERERRALLRRHPEVTDWSAWLDQQGEEIITTPLRRARRASSVAYARV